MDAGAAVKYAANLSCSENPENPGQGNGNNGNGGVGTTNPTVGQGNNSGNVGVNGQGGPRVTNSGGTEISEGRYAAEDTDTSIDKGVSIEATVYPNPSKGRTTIKWGEYTEGMTLMVYDSESNLIMTKDISSSETSAQVDAPVSGMYYVRLVQNGQQVWMGKFIKL